MSNVPTAAPAALPPRAFFARRNRFVIRPEHELGPGERLIRRVRRLVLVEEIAGGRYASQSPKSSVRDVEHCEEASDG